jgi:F-type H+-transporting ATPase subunit a
LKFYFWYFYVVVSKMLVGKLQLPTFAPNFEKNMMHKRYKHLLIAAFSVFSMLFAKITFANETPLKDSVSQATTAHHEEKDINVSELILEHIGDSYNWHLWGHLSVNLPVILYSNKGLEVFSSSNLVDEHHQHVVYKGKNDYKVLEGKVKIVNAAGLINEEENANLLDFSITKNVAALLFSVLVLLIIFIKVGNAYKKTGVTSAPKGLQSWLEPVVLFVRDDVAKPTIGHKYEKYMPLLLTIFFLILVNNFLGLIPIIPGGANLSGNIAFTMVLSVIVFFVVNLNANKDYWQHIFWMPGMHWSMKLFLAPIELIGVFVKPISLMIRLFANITAGHVLVLSLICLIFIFKHVAAGAIAVPFAVFISLIEVLVAFLQAFIFTMLTGMYIGMAIEEHHHEEAHH